MFYNRPRTIIYVLSLLTFVFSVNAFGQRVALKTNALYWGALTPNLGAEFRLSRHYTLNVEAAANPFTISGNRLHAAAFTPEVRYWFSARPHARHFVGVMALGATYDLIFSDKHYEGDALGGGLTYGYSFVLSRRLSLETTLGVGALHYRGQKYGTGEAAPDDINQKKTILAPLKAGVTLTYILK